MRALAMTDLSDATTETTSAFLQRPKRADARRNYDKLIAAAREVFAENGASASLEDIARRAEVGIGTLYRHFPTRQALLEAVYLEEVEAVCRSVDDFAGLPPWEALVGWLHRFVGYAVTKRALLEELMATVDVDPDSDVFRSCRVAISDAGESLLERAQASGDVRPDVRFLDVGRMVGGIAVIRMADPEQIERILDLALDGLRYRPGA
jgi:AcrR family transcriptional regulator